MNTNMRRSSCFLWVNILWNLFGMDLIGQYRFFDTQIVVNGGIPLGTSYQTRQIVVSYFLCNDFICIISFSRSTYLQRLLKISSPTLNTFLSTCTLDLPICSSHTFIFNFLSPENRIDSDPQHGFGSLYKYMLL